MGRSPYGNSMSCSKDVSSSGNPHHHSHSHHHHQQQHHHSMLKKGAWTPEEDQKLIDYINEHGHGNWRALPKKCGLMRCGKSCRLRWTNYLRPDIKRGAFAPSEEQKIIQLHALVGNRWAFIASQLPKRTDNEIKNYWNTVLKKRTQKPAAAAQSAITMGGTSATSSAMTPESLMGMFAAAAARSGGGGGGAPDQANTGGGLDINMWMYSMQKSASKPPPNVAAAAASGSNHLAQWETARLEAEARLAQQSKAAPPASSSAAAASAKPKPQSLDWLFRFNLNSSPPTTTAPPSHSAAAAAKKSSGSGSIFSFLPDPDGHDISRHFNAIATPPSAANNNSASSSSETAELSVAARSGGTAAKALQQQVEGGGSMKYHAATTSAIKLGSNGRLSWNKHELSLPSLTCVAAPPLPPPPPPPPSNSTAASILLDCLHSHSSPPPEDRHDMDASMKPSRDLSMLTHVTSAAAAMENMINGGGTAAANSSSENGLSNLLGNIAPNLHDLMMEVDTASCSKSMRSSSSSINDSCIKLSQLIDSKNNHHHHHHNHHHNHNHQSSFNVLDFYSILSHGGHSGDQKSNPNLLARSSNNNNNNILMDDPQQTQTRNGAAAATPSSSKLNNTSTHHSHNLIHSHHNLNSSNFQLLNHAFDHAASINQLQGLNFQQIAENLMLGEPNVESQFNNLLMDLNLC